MRQCSLRLLGCTFIKKLNELIRKLSSTCYKCKYTLGVVHRIRIFMPARVYADYLCLTFKIFYFSGTVWPQVYRWHLMCVCSDQYEWKEFVLTTIFYRRQGKQIFILVANCLNFSHFCNPTWRRALLGLLHVIIWTRYSYVGLPHIVFWINIIIDIFVHSLIKIDQK